MTGVSRGKDGVQSRAVRPGVESFVLGKTKNGKSVKT